MTDRTSYWIATACLVLSCTGLAHWTVKLSGPDMALWAGAVVLCLFLRRVTILEGAR